MSNSKGWSLGSVFRKLLSTTAGEGAALVGYKGPWALAPDSTVNEELHHFVYCAPTGGDDTLSLQSAIDYAESLVTAAVDATGDRVNGCTVMLRGAYRVSDPLRVSDSNVCIYGQGGTTVYPYFTSATGYNGAKPVFIIGTAEDWQNAGVITGTTKYNRIRGINIKRVTGYNGFIGFLFSGTRNAVLSDCLVERGYCAVYLENTSEFEYSQVSAVGCTYGEIWDNRGNRLAANSVLNVACVDNDVSSITRTQVTCYYPQHTGLLTINCGTMNVSGGTMGRFSENAVGSPALGLPSDAAAIHVLGGNSGNTKWTRAGGFENLVFEADPSTSKTCIRLDSGTANNPILGLSFERMHVQTYAAAEDRSAVTTLIRAVQSGSGDIRHVVVRDSGFTYQSSGYYYGDLCHSTGACDIAFEHCYPTVAFATSKMPPAGVVHPVVHLERVNIDAFPPTGWTAIGTTAGCSKQGDASGVPASLKFTGDAAFMTVYKRFTIRNQSDEMKTMFVSCMARGDADIYLKARINNDSATATDIISATTKGMYGQTLYSDRGLDSTYRRIVWVIKPNAVGFPFDTCDFWLGRVAGSSGAYSEIKDIRVGYFTGVAEVLNPF